MKKKRFFRNIATISCFGIIGTYVAFAVIASVLYGISLLPNILELSVRAYLLPALASHKKAHATACFRNACEAQPDKIEAYVIPRHGGILPHKSSHQHAEKALLRVTQPVAQPHLSSHFRDYY